MTDSRRRLRAAVAAPLAAFLAATLLVGAAAEVAGWDAFDAQSWARWDSKHYVRIARDGYSAPAGCGEIAIVCAHAGWLPGYSALFALPVAIGASPVPAGLAASWLFCLGALVLLWTRFLREGPREARIAGLAFAALVPGMVYQHAVFPLSALTLFALLALLALARSRWPPAALAGAAAAATYPLGVLLAPLGAVAAVGPGRERLAPRLLRAAAVGAAIAAGFGLVLLVQRLQLGDWLAYFTAQDHPLRSPLAGIREQWSRSRLEGEIAVGVQALVTAALAAAVAALLLLRRAALTRLDLLCAGFVLAVWLLPLCQSGVSVYRSNAALVPAAPLLRHLGRPLRWAFVLACAAIAVPVAVLFFDYRLV